MKEQHAEDMAIINKLIDKLDAKNTGNQSQIELGSPNPSPKAKAAEEPSGKGGPVEAAKAPEGSPKPADPAPKRADDPQTSLVGIIKELTHLATMLTELVAKLIPAAPTPKPEPPPPGMVPLKGDPAKASAN